MSFIIQKSQRAFNNMLLSNFVLLCIYSLALRWLVFRYKKFQWFRTALKSSKWQLLSELSECCYCQTIEASFIVYSVLWATGSSIAIPHAFFSILANGWVAIAIEAVIEKNIAATEDLHEVSFKAESGNSAQAKTVGFRPQ